MSINTMISENSAVIMIRYIYGDIFPLQRKKVPIQVDIYMVNWAGPAEEALFLSALPEFC